MATTGINHANSDSDAPEPIVGGRGASILGPRNVPIETANPDLLVPPYTDAGTVPNLKFPYAQAHQRLHTRGGARGEDPRAAPREGDRRRVHAREDGRRLRAAQAQGKGEWAHIL